MPNYQSKDIIKVNEKKRKCDFREDTTSKRIQMSSNNEKNEVQFTEIQNVIEDSRILKNKSLVSNTTSKNQPEHELQQFLRDNAGNDLCLLKKLMTEVRQDIQFLTKKAEKNMRMVIEDIKDRRCVTQKLRSILDVQVRDIIETQSLQDRLVNVQNVQIQQCVDLLDDLKNEFDEGIEYLKSNSEKKLKIDINTQEEFNNHSSEPSIAKTTEHKKTNVKTRRSRTLSITLIEEENILQNDWELKSDKQNINEDLRNSKHKSFVSNITNDKQSSFKKLIQQVEEFKEDINHLHQKIDKISVVITDNKDEHEDLQNVTQELRNVLDLHTAHIIDITSQQSSVLSTQIDPLMDYYVKLNNTQKKFHQEVKNFKSNYNGKSKRL